MGGLTVLDRVSLSVTDGEFVSIIGPSGCGKSTLLDIIAGLQEPDCGEICLDGQQQHSLLGKVGYMPQKDLLLPWRILVDNVALPLLVAGESKTAARHQARELLADFGLSEFANYYPSQLSGGMRQRAALLRTYLTGRNVWLLDEPFGATDALTRRELQQWLLQVLAQFRGSVLLVTHDIDEAIFLSTRIYVISRLPGQVIGEYVVPVPREERSFLLNQPKLQLLKEKLLLGLTGIKA